MNKPRSGAKKTETAERTCKFAAVPKGPEGLGHAGQFRAAKQRKRKMGRQNRPMEDVLTIRSHGHQNNHREAIMSYG